MPSLYRSAAPGSLEAVTRPDGMYVHLARDEASSFLTADVLALEHCGVRANVHDKRSRYPPSNGSLLLKLPRSWLSETSRLRQRRGRRQDEALRETWNSIGGVFAEQPHSNFYAAVTRLRLFLFVPDKDLDEIGRSVALEAHEYLLPHSSLNNQYAPRLVLLLEHAFHRRIWATDSRLTLDSK
jgi:hypothetical protein